MARRREHAIKPPFWPSKNEKDRFYAHVRRVRIAENRIVLPEGRFTAREIFERDGWRCGICHRKVDRRKKHPDPMSANLDHIVPLSEGGGHVRSNVQCSHAMCNVRKSDGRIGAQLLLFG